MLARGFDSRLMADFVTPQPSMKCSRIAAINARLVKTYAQPMEEERCHSPTVGIGALKVKISGAPDEAKICTSHIERQNLTMRMRIRRLTRLTSAFSKSIDSPPGSGGPSLRPLQLLQDSRIVASDARNGSGIH
jgi:hypothetical protein